MHFLGPFQRSAAADWDDKLKTKKKKPTHQKPSRKEEKKEKTTREETPSIATEQANPRPGRRRGGGRRCQRVDVAALRGGELPARRARPQPRRVSSSPQRRPGQQHGLEEGRRPRHLAGTAPSRR